MSFESLDRSTCLPESADGVSRCGSLDGTTTRRFGPAPVRVSPSHVRALAKGPPIRVISGRKCSGSSRTAGLQSALESKLKARMAAYGSMEYELTWKHWDLVSGPRICALRASRRRTFGSDCSGWPTPDSQAMNSNCDIDKHMARMERLKAKHNNGNGAGLTLGAASQLAGWPTPDHHRHGEIHDQAALDRRVAASKSSGSDKRTLNLNDAAKLAGWATPRREDSESTGAHNGTADTLHSQSQLAGWGTPSMRDHKDSPGMAETGTNPDGTERSRIDQFPRQVHGLIGWDSPQSSDHQGNGHRTDGRPKLPGQAGLTSTSSTAGTESRGVLAPALPRWLMGFPEAWDRSSPGHSDFTTWQQLVSRSRPPRRIALGVSEATATPSCRN